MIVFFAALSMFLQDLLAVSLVQAEARNRAALAAVLDALMWPAQIFCTTVSVTALQGHDFSLKTAVIVAITMANLVGSYTAVKLGQRYIKEKKLTPLACSCGCVCG